MAVFGKRKTATPDRTSDVLERPDYGWIWKPLLALLVLYLLVTIALGFWWSREPEPFDVSRVVDVQRGNAADDTADAASAEARSGAVTAATLMTMVDTLLDKPGGYLRNDMMPPGLWLDNQPNWEYGVLRQVRDMSSALSSFDAGEPESVEAATQRFQANSRDWLYPSTERRLEQGRDALGNYLVALGAGEAEGFHGEGDAMVAWLERVDDRLDSLTSRLSASVDDPDVLQGVDVDSEDGPAKTPWYKVDDYFYEARGSAWALMHLFQALQRDQASLLEAADATALVDGIVAELERTQRRLWSPVVLNGSGFGVFANHSLMMANYTQRAGELITDLSQQLESVEVGEGDASSPSDTDTQRQDEGAEEEGSDESSNESVEDSDGEEASDESNQE
ncbi:hypothetical protein SAMN05443545_10550 [Aidingimonas halophila]|uniref:DUF2333 domain-containing protein n=2 Tax=Aidingimonas halophila TaxID=574349 RepID=A0A1H3AWD7_9GAMM|nr:hypothetical protein SAMN05443545_10550 [Aidingimonas halophila]